MPKIAQIFYLLNRGNTIGFFKDSKALSNFNEEEFLKQITLKHILKRELNNALLLNLENRILHFLFERNLIFGLQLWGGVNFIQNQELIPFIQKKNHL